ncbi:hypothetical protein ISN45_Aa02g007180 [Arabidopsis thaliana x Arabidopsis arenosa]|uniref:Pentatricopeptide repeat-containing protein n=1 Tax=Arabidopsis thaliana x Arabidopsis arenosa TaxID=1240361 RepID=A0A8T2BNT1_9BRAS|nr:hypothetical protein ISN45_Aa02g007180 [Arabidopsis thaliana x Arabidopsis arenosa]
MESKVIKPNGFTIVSLLSTCAKLGALIYGKRVHVYMIKVGLTRNLYSNNVLLNLYVRCGRVEEAKTLKRLSFSGIWNQRRAYYRVRSRLWETKCYNLENTVRILYVFICRIRTTRFDWVQLRS